MLNLISLFGVWYWRTGPQCNVKIGFAHPTGTQRYSPVIHKSSVYIQLQFKCAKSSLSCRKKKSRLLKADHPTLGWQTLRAWPSGCGTSPLIWLDFWQVKYVDCSCSLGLVISQCSSLFCFGNENNLYWAPIMCQVVQIKQTQTKTPTASHFSIFSKILWVNGGNIPILYLKTIRSREDI